MRALCGAIITAGALIGLGLTALAFGIRFGGPAFGPEAVHANTNALWGTFSMTLILIVLLIGLLIGLAISFLGLAFHHYRRYHEHLRATEHHGEPRRVETPVAT